MPLPNKDIKARMQSFYDKTINYNQAVWREGSIDARLEAGDPTVLTTLYTNFPNNHRLFNFNRVKRVVSMISGYQRQYRKNLTVIPVENADQETADQFSKILSWITQQENLNHTISTAFHSALISGISFLQVWVDYRSDPLNGNVRIDFCPFNSFLVDPYFKKADLSDCSGVWKRSYLTPQECYSLLPEQRKELEEMSLHGAHDGKFYFTPESYNLSHANLMTYDEFYYREYRPQQLLVDTQTGETLEWKGKDEERLRQYLQTYPTVKVIDTEVPTVNLAILVNENVMYDGPSPLGDIYPLVPIFAYYNPQLVEYNLRVQSVVRGLRDAQMLYTRRKIIELSILESQVSSGWIYRASSLKDPQSVFQQGEGVGIGITDNADIDRDLRQIQPPQVPPSMIELSRGLAEEVEQISGVNSELLGSAQDDKAGILSMLRQGAGLVTLQQLFDQLDQSMSILGKLLITIIQNNFTPGKVERIIEQQPTQQFYDLNWGRYDGAVEEGLNTTLQRQQQLAQLLHLKEAGVAVPDKTLINACTVQNKTELLKDIEEAQQQAAQAQQMQLQATIQEQQARTQLAQSRSVADQGLGLERLSRIQENKALAEERRAQAVKDENSALLDLVKALKEIDGLDIAHMKELLALHAMVKGEENANEVVSKTKETNGKVSGPE